MPTVSICLPVYNGQRYLKEAIESVLEQTYGDFELIISDDASRDQSLQIAREFEALDRRIKVVSNQQNLGLFANYNSCMKKAQGKYIKLFAQDDLLAKDMLARALEVFAADGEVALMSTARTAINELGEKERFGSQLDSSRLIKGGDLIKGCLLRTYNWIGEPSTVMFPASRMGEGFDTSFHHIGDLEYWMRIVGQGNYVYLNEPLCSFRVHRGSATRRNMISLLFVIDMLRLGRLYERQLFEIGIDEVEYIRRSLEFCAGYLSNLARAEGITAQQSAAVDLGCVDKDLLLGQFRELAFEALCYAHEVRLNLEAARIESDDELRKSEDRLKAVLDTRLWKAAQSLRHIIS